MSSFTLRALLGVLLLLSTVPAAAGERDREGGRQTVTVMTRNLYFGADLGPVLAASPEALFEAVGAAYAAAVASRIPERMEAIADEIERLRPDLIGLQEAALWRTGPFTPPARSVATTVAFDFIELLLGALAARGLDYDVAAETINLDVQLPGVTASGLEEIRLTDRDAILVRRGGRGPTLQWWPHHVQVGTFAAAVAVPTVLGPIVVPRGWAAIDVGLGPGRLRFVTTHLETLSAAVQMAQAQELLLGPAATDLPLILVCDCNSSADGGGPDATPTYGALIAAGLDDAWTAARGGAHGFTCCQAADLSNVPSALNERIDLVLLRGDIEVRGARRTGARPGERTPAPERLWPSDHAGVIATLRVTPGSDHGDDR